MADVLGKMKLTARNADGIASTGQATPTRKNSGRLMAMNSSTRPSRAA